MIIQFNTDHNVKATEEFKAPLIAIITNHLHQFSEHINRLDIHMADENGGKTGVDDKRCTIEARLTGSTPIAVSADASTYEQAAVNAGVKLKTSIGNKIERLKSHYNLN